MGRTVPIYRWTGIIHSRKHTLVYLATGRLKRGWFASCVLRGQWKQSDGATKCMWGLSRSTQSRSHFFDQIETRTRIPFDKTRLRTSRFRLSTEFASGRDPQNRRRNLRRPVTCSFLSQLHPLRIISRPNRASCHPETHTPGRPRDSNGLIVAVFEGPSSIAAGPGNRDASQTILKVKPWTPRTRRAPPFLRRAAFSRRLFARPPRSRLHRSNLQLAWSTRSTTTLMSRSFLLPRGLAL